MRRLHALVLALGTAAVAPAFAETVTYYIWDPVSRSYIERTIDRSQPAVAGTYAAPSTTTTYVAPATTTTYVEPVTPYVAPSTAYVAPTVTYVDPPVTYVGPDIVVTAPRSVDGAITADVVDRIAATPDISGQIGVETYNRDVTLTGRTVTQGQKDRAEQAARSVDGVRDVNNLIRPRVGQF